MDLSKLALLVSGASLLIALATFWFTHLRPFKLSISTSSPRLSMYTISPQVSGDSENRTWWIPSFDVGVSVFNNGKMKGDFNDIRIVGSIQNHRSEKKMYFYPKWVVDFSKFNQFHTERFEWLSNSIVRDWYPFRIGSEQEVSMHLILEGDRLDHKEVGRFNFELQVSTSESNGWQTLEGFELLFSEDMYDERSTHSPLNKKIERLRKIA